MHGKTKIEFLKNLDIKTIPAFLCVQAQCTKSILDNKKRKPNSIEH